MFLLLVLLSCRYKRDDAHGLYRICYANIGISRHLRLTIPLEFICACPAASRGTHSLVRPSSLSRAPANPTPLSKWQRAIFLLTRWKKKKKESRPFYLTLTAGRSVQAGAACEKTVYNFKPLCCMRRWQGHSCAAVQESEQRVFSLVSVKGLFHYPSLDRVSLSLAKLNFHYHNNSRCC